MLILNNLVKFSSTILCQVLIYEISLSIVEISLIDFSEISCIKIFNSSIWPDCRLFQDIIQSEYFLNVLDQFKIFSLFSGTPLDECLRECDRQFNHALGYDFAGTIDYLSKLDKNVYVDTTKCVLSLIRSLWTLEKVCLCARYFFQLVDFY